MQNNTFSTLFVGQNLIRLAEVDSTNNFLKISASKSEPLPEGTVIMADHQYAGRGQQENTWHTSAGMNLTFSIYLCPVFLPVNQQFMLNMAVSVAIRTALNRLLGGMLNVKWPNDLYCNDQKIGGILIENVISGPTYKSAIIGIGINVNQLNFAEELLGKATSIAKILQRDVNLLELLTILCSHVEAEYLQLKAGSFNQLQYRYLNGLYRFKKMAGYRHKGVVFEGEIVDVTAQGQLVILVEGLKKQYNFKEVEFLNNI